MARRWTSSIAWMSCSRYGEQHWMAYSKLVATYVNFVKLDEDVLVPVREGSDELAKNLISLLDGLGNLCSRFERLVDHHP